MTTTWYADHDLDGSISRLIRVHDDPDGLWGEFLRDGSWITDPTVLAVRTDPSWGSEISASEGIALARSLGASD